MVFKLMIGMTGTGYMIKETIDIMKELQEEFGENISITVMLSKEGAAVVKWYKQWDYLTETVKKVHVEKTPNIPFFAGALQIGKYDMFICCPVSANSTAKIVYGIADTLITNCVAQAIKGGITVYIFPSDQDFEPIVTSKPNGEPLVLKIRDIEIENINKLNKMEGIFVIKSFADIKNLILEKIKDKIQ
jgi:archaeoflavoprotein AfpA